MVVVQELIHSLVMLVNIFFTILYWLLVVRIVLSWFGVSPYTAANDMLSALYQITDVILRPFQKLPLRIGSLDLSPIVAFIALQFVQRLLVIVLYSLGGMAG
ncbi:MAG: YggT family protein [Candidatus Omnitrophica bacterium]|nr:YggT family protein [Candidatus Omnitrophota bacterium]